jgi:hypothetical protein
MYMEMYEQEAHVEEGRWQSPATGVCGLTHVAPDRGRRAVLYSF